MGCASGPRTCRLRRKARAQMSVGNPRGVTRPSCPQPLAVLQRRPPLSASLLVLCEFPTFITLPSNDFPVAHVSSRIVLGFLAAVDPKPKKKSPIRPSLVLLADLELGRDALDGGEAKRPPSFDVDWFARSCIDFVDHERLPSCWMSSEHLPTSVYVALPTASCFSPFQE